MNNIIMEMAMKVAPSGLPRWRRCLCAESEDDDDEEGELERRLVFRRKSCVIAMPMEAKERDVRSQARNVRSVIVC